MTITLKVRDCFSSIKDPDVNRAMLDVAKTKRGLETKQQARNAAALKQASEKANYEFRKAHFLSTKTSLKTQSSALALDPKELLKSADQRDFSVRKQKAALSLSKWKTAQKLERTVSLLSPSSTRTASPVTSSGSPSPIFMDDSDSD